MFERNVSPFMPWLGTVQYSIGHERTFWPGKIEEWQNLLFFGEIFELGFLESNSNAGGGIYWYIFM